MYKIGLGIGIAIIAVLISLPIVNAITEEQYNQMNVDFVNTTNNALYNISMVLGNSNPPYIYIENLPTYEQYCVYAAQNITAEQCD